MAALDDLYRMLGSAKSVSADLVAGGISSPIELDADPEVRAKQIKAADAANQVAIQRKKNAERAANQETPAVAPAEQFQPLQTGKGGGSTPLDMLAAYQAQAAPSAIQTSVDANNNMTITGPANEMGGLIGQIRQWQAKSQMLDQQLAERDAQLQQDAMRARANPLVHALGMLSANIASQPQMPGIVRALGQTAAQMRSENDPELIEAKRRQIIQDRLAISRSAVEQGLAEEKFTTTAAAKADELERKQFNDAVRSLKRLPGPVPPEFFTQIRNPELRQQLSDLSKENFESIKKDQEFKAEGLKLKRDALESIDSYRKKLANIRSQANTIRATENQTKATDPVLAMKRTVDAWRKLRDATSRETAQLSTENASIRSRFVTIADQLVDAQTEAEKYRLVGDAEGVARINGRMRLLEDTKAALQTQLEQNTKTLAELEAEREDFMSRVQLPGKAGAPAAAAGTPEGVGKTPTFKIIPKPPTTQTKGK